MLGQSRHQEILRKHLYAAGGVVEFNTSLNRLVQGGDSVVAEIAKTAPDGEEIRETCQYAYIVGADGAHSMFHPLQNQYFILILPGKVLCGNPSE